MSRTIWSPYHALVHALIMDQSEIIAAWAGHDLERFNSAVRLLGDHIWKMREALGGSQPVRGM